MNPSSPIALSLKAAIGGFFVLLILHILVWMLFQWPTIMLYPVHLLAYYLVGRVAAGNALSEDPTGAGIEINFASIGGLSGLILGILIWGFQGIASLLLEITELGGFMAGFFGWLLCFAVNLPISVGIGAAGGRAAEPRD